VVEERERVVSALCGLGATVWPSGANFVLFRPVGRRGERLAGRAVWQGLLDRSVLVRDCSSWPRLDDCLRVTIGTPVENDRFLSALSEVLT
jgi:histidinol-phosphate aminotransferase